MAGTKRVLGTPFTRMQLAIDLPERELGDAWERPMENAGPCLHGPRMRIDIDISEEEEAPVIDINLGPPLPAIEQEFALAEDDDETLSTSTPPGPQRSLRERRRGPSSRWAVHFTREDSDGVVETRWSDVFEIPLDAHDMRPCDVSFDYKKQKITITWTRHPRYSVHAPRDWIYWRRPESGERDVLNIQQRDRMAPNPEQLI